MAALLSACGAPPATEAPETVVRQSPSAEDSASRSRQLQIFQQTLESTSTELDSATRQAAAAELLGHASPEATRILAQVLTSGREAEVAAVIAALSSTDQPDPALRVAAVDALGSAPPSTWVPLGGLLARYSQSSTGTLTAVVALAVNPETPLSEREAALVSLGEFHGQPLQAAEAIVQVLRQSPPPPLPAIGMTSLSQLTGLPRNDNLEGWLTWWDDNRDRPASLWLSDTIQAQSRRIAAIESELRQAQDLNRLVVTRLVNVYRDLWPLLEIEQQVERIPAMLEDDRAEVRAFGVERIAVLLRDVRDGQATEAIEHAVVERLGDPEVEIRRQVAALLTELSNPNVVDTVTARLEVEPDPEVLISALRYLQTRGDRASLAKMLPLLTRDETREAAAETVWSLVKDAPPSRDEQAELLETLGPGPADPSIPALAALWVLAVPDDMLNQANGLLDHGNDDTRTAVAEALLRRGRYDPLLGHGTDPAIYQVALEAAIHKPASRPLERMDRVLELPPTQEPHRASWADAIALAAASVPVEEQVTLDERLSQHPSVDEYLRITVLNQAVADENLSQPTRIALLRRLVPLLLETNQAKTALAKLDAIPDERLDEELASMRFRAALLGHVFDAAASVHDEPEPWITFYESTRETHPDESETLRSEITRRFNDLLDPAMKARLGIAVDPTMPDSAASANADDDGEDGQPR